MADKRSGTKIVDVDPSLHDRVVGRRERFVGAFNEAAINPRARNGRSMKRRTSKCGLSYG
jgi:hypothetical protein